MPGRLGGGASSAGVSPDVSSSEGDGRCADDGREDFCDSTSVNDRWWLESGVGERSRVGMTESGPVPKLTRTDLFWLLRVPLMAGAGPDWVSLL